MKTYIVTGATRGLGLATTRALLERPDVRVVMAVRDVAAGEALARTLGPRVEVRGLDLSSLAAVDRFVASWTGPLAGLMNNAGLQQTAGTRLTAEGLEESFTVNHLAAFQLTRGLLPALAGGGRVLFVGSGTHNPDNRTATRFGFRGARFTSVAALARGESDGDTDARKGLDRYATGKWLNMVSAVEWTRRVDPARTTFLTLDPGLMAGTGLARTRSAVERAAWSSVLRLVAPLMADTSTPRRSGATAAWLLTGAEVTPGEIYAYDRRPSTRVWPPTRDADVGRRVFDETEAFLSTRAQAPGSSMQGSTALRDAHES